MCRMSSFLFTAAATVLYTSERDSEQNLRGFVCVWDAMYMCPPGQFIVVYSSPITATSETTLVTFAKLKDVLLETSSINTDSHKTRTQNYSGNKMRPQLTVFLLDFERTVQTYRHRALLGCFAAYESSVLPQNRAFSPHFQISLELCPRSGRSWRKNAVEMYWEMSEVGLIILYHAGLYQTALSQSRKSGENEKFFLIISHALQHTGWERLT